MVSGWVLRRKDEVLILPEATRAARAQVRKYGTVAKRAAAEAVRREFVDAEALLDGRVASWRIISVVWGNWESKWTPLVKVFGIR